MAQLIEGSKILKLERGGIKSALKEEQSTIDFAYSTVVAIKRISKGELLTEDNIWVKRPGTGEILAEHYNELLGKSALNDIPCDKHLCWADIQK
jgi:sialic acid synthase SpsE